MLWPPCLLFRLQGALQGNERAVESLTLAISLRVVRGGPGLAYTVLLAQQLHHLGLELATLIGVDPEGNPKIHYPLLNQGLHHCSSSLVPGYERHGELGEDVCYNEDVLVAIR